MAADAKKRGRAIVSTASSAKESSTPVLKKVLADNTVKSAARGAVVTKGAIRLSEPNKKKTGKK